MRDFLPSSLRCGLNICGLVDNRTEYDSELVKDEIQKREGGSEAGRADA